jgi:ABC-type sugar transport system ATPase subunit
VELKKLQRELGVTAIFVTHDQIEAMTMGDRIAVMNDGHLEQMGTPAELYEHPRNKFVAGFIGSPPMNMLEGRLEKKEGRAVIDLGFRTYELPETAKGILREATETRVILGIRPENIIITKESRAHAFEATVVHIELTGKESNVHLRLWESPIIAIRTLTHDLTVDDRVWLSFDEEKVHVFEQESGKALL